MYFSIPSKRILHRMHSDCDAPSLKLESLMDPMCVQPQAPTPVCHDGATASDEGSMPINDIFALIENCKCCEEFMR